MRRVEKGEKAAKKRANTEITTLINNVLKMKYRVSRVCCVNVGV